MLTLSSYAQNSLCKQFIQKTIAMQPEIHVGIIFAPRITFDLAGNYILTGKDGKFTGQGAVEIAGDGKYELTINEVTQEVVLPVVFIPKETETSSFELKDVTIGINFHWERQENQRFTGGLKIIEENGHLTAINILPLEDYLRSVISSEMSATSSEELLKAHAVISRSWLLAQIEKGENIKQAGPYSTIRETENERIRWYDREDHQNFDVCADDHCQRYQGITKASTSAVDKAIKDTFGEVLVYDGQICDARYSKCCGGISEIFENVWEPVHHPYLVKVIDNERPPERHDTVLDSEGKAEKWILETPEAFCNTHDKEVLSQVLNDYDQETSDFYRWNVTLEQNEIRGLLKEKLDLEVGDILDLIPVERGVSGRLIKLEIKGSEKSVIIGKELEIRKAFSRSHLYSSAFVVEKEHVENGVPRKFTFHGAGWGHGVGLCQIGAAVMGARGYSYHQILFHYFKGAELERRY
jgi:stage II sporulation protein D